MKAGHNNVVIHFFFYYFDEQVLKTYKNRGRLQPLRLKKKSILDNFLQSFFFMLKIKKTLRNAEISMFLRV